MFSLHKGSKSLVEEQVYWVSLPTFWLTFTKLSLLNIQTPTNCQRRCFCLTEFNKWEERGILLSPLWLFLLTSLGGRDLSLSELSVWWNSVHTQSRCYFAILFCNNEMLVNLDLSSSEIGSIFFCRRTGVSKLSANSVVRKTFQENNMGNVSGLQMCHTVNGDSKNMHVLLGQWFSKIFWYAPWSIRIKKS